MSDVQIKDAGGATVTTRTVFVDGKEWPATLISEMFETPVSPTGATTTYSVGSGAAVPLDPPTAGARYARIRVWHGTQDMSKRLYYRTDGTAATVAGAFGFLIHLDVFYVKLKDLADFSMISESGETFEVLAEFLDLDEADA